MDWMSVALLLAQENKPAPGMGGEMLQFLLPIVAILLLFNFMIRVPQKREQAARDAMLSAMKKNDKVLTIGGMIGTVANISPDGQEVTLKVDDNTRIRMIRSSIQRVLSAEGEADKPAETK